MKKVWNYLLCMSLILTMLVFITEIWIHKLAATVFVVLCIYHCVKHKNRFNIKYILLFILVLICFVSGIVGMVSSPYLIFHKVMALLLVCFLVVHVYMFHKSLKISLKN